jgi:hypothetical protein
MGADANNIGIGHIENEEALRIGSAFLVTDRQDRVRNRRPRDGVDHATVDSEAGFVGCASVQPREQRQEQKCKHRRSDHRFSRGSIDAKLRPEALSVIRKRGSAMMCSRGVTSRRSSVKPAM